MLGGEVPEAIGSVVDKVACALYNTSTATLTYHYVGNGWIQGAGLFTRS